MKNKEKIKYFYEHIVSNHLLETLSDYIAEDCAIRIGEQLYPVGLEGMRQHLIA